MVVGSPFLDCFNELVLGIGNPDCSGIAGGMSTVISSGANAEGKVAFGTVVQEATNDGIFAVQDIPETEAENNK